MPPPDFRRVADEALRQAHDLVARWLPDGHRSGNEWVARNPRRADTSLGSFSVNMHKGAWADFATGERGGDLVSLFAYLNDLKQGEACAQLARELGLDGGSGAPAPGPRPTADRASKPAAQGGGAAIDDGSAVVPVPADAPPYRPLLDDRRHGQASGWWEYRDAEGRLLQVIARWEAQPRKLIRPLVWWRYPDGRAEWRYKALPRPRPLYGLDRLAALPDATVVVTEGEKAADAATKLLGAGYVTITSPGGSENGAHADWSPVAGRRVIVWPDADDPGAEYAKVVVDRARRANAASVQVLALGWVHALRLALTPHRDGALPKGYDAADLVAELVADAAGVPLPAMTFLDLPAPPPARLVLAERETGNNRRSRIPAGMHHRALVDRLRSELTRRGYAPDAVDGWRRTTGQMVTVSLSDLAADIWFDLLEDEGISRQHVTDVFAVLTKRERLRRRATLVGQLTGRPSTPAGREALAAWVKAVTGREGEAASTDCKVMGHWLWLVKRCACELSTQHDIMPVLFGEQRGGKSRAVYLLLGPLEELQMTIGAQTLTDERRFRALGQVLVGFWDEMQGAQRAEVEALKHTITAPTLNYRELSTHSTVQLRRTASFIGASNNEVAVMVGDTTGAGRFYQLNAQPVLDWQAVNAIDYTALWQAVSEQDPAPIIEVLHLVRVAQADLVHRDAVSMWLEAETWAPLVIRLADREQPLTVPPYDPERGESFEHVAARFRHWCQVVGQTPIGPKEFAKRLKQERFTTYRPDARPGLPRPRYYKRPPVSPGPAHPSTSAPGQAAPAPTDPPGAARDARGVRMGSTPSSAEDVLADDDEPEIPF